jgi:hypothetical protein
MAKLVALHQLNKLDLFFIETSILLYFQKTRKGHIGRRSS